MDLKRAYEILGVNQNDDFNKIKKRYKELCKKYHPDLYQDENIKELTEEKLKEVNEAYSIISETHNTYNNSTSSNEDSIKFDWLGFSWKISRELEKYNVFRKEVELRIEDTLKDYVKQYQDYGNLNNFLKLDQTNVKRIVKMTFDYLVDICINSGIDMYSSSKLTEVYFEKVSLEYRFLYQKYYNFSISLDEERELKKQEKKIKDAWNGTDGLISKTIRGAGNVWNELADNNKKQALYEKESTLKELKRAIKNTIYACLDEVLNILKIEAPINPDYADSILENINKYSEKQKSEKLLQALIGNPYDKYIYLKILDLYGDCDKNLEKIAIYFGVDNHLKYFKEIRIKEYIDEFREELKKKEVVALSNFKYNMYFIGARISEYVDIEAERKNAKAEQMNQFLEEFRKSKFENIEEAKNILKENTEKLGVKLEEYCNLDEEVNIIREKEIKECIENFKKELTDDKEKAKKSIEKLEKTLEKLQAKAEDYINIEEECIKAEKFMKRMKKLRNYVVIIILAFTFWGTIGKELIKNISKPSISTRNEESYSSDNYNAEEVINDMSSKFLYSNLKINLSPLKEIKNKAILNVNEYTTNRYDGGWRSYEQPDRNNWVEITTFTKEEKIAYLLGVSLADYDYYLYCNRDGSFSMKIYNRNNCIFMIPNMETPNINYSNIDSSEIKKHMTTMQLALSLFRKFDKLNQLQIGI